MQETLNSPQLGNAPSADVPDEPHISIPGGLSSHAGEDEDFGSKIMPVDLCRTRLIGPASHALPCRFLRGLGVLLCI